MEQHALMKYDPTSSDLQRHDALRADVAQNNADALCQLCLKHGLVLPRQGKDWRPCTPVEGNIAGVIARLTILCTDGVVGYFLEENGKACFYGHISHFTGKVKTMFALPKENSGPASEASGTEASPRKPSVSRKKLTVSLAMDLLRRLGSRG